MAHPFPLIDEALSAIEARELRSLQWGFVDGSLAQDETLSLLEDALAATGGGAVPADVLEELVQRRLIFERRQPDGTIRYRSRFAEGVRLLTSLRQLFPGRPWISAPELVSDYRVSAARRSFPRRDVPPEAARAALAESPLWSDEHAELAEALLPPDGHRLAAFQLRAAAQVVQDSGLDRGLVVCAGTGSGKTLAFYLPAVLELGTLVRRNEHWVKAVALYPRIELLKDQFSQTYQFVRRTDQVLLQRGRRPLRLGTYFSLTPFERSVPAVSAVWPKSGAGFVCPFLLCLVCGGDLVWKEKDIQGGVDRLVCRVPDCHGTVPAEHVVLTRREMVERPPDIVFATTEMLNQRLSDPSARHVLGVTRQRGRQPRLVLLDEVHTYSGPTGAQTALVLRRWRKAIGAPVRFVGLSATLREAPQFFGELVGLDPASVVEVSPADEEMEHRSMIYQLVLRGNPAAQTQLLSTSIQAGFLLARLMDPFADDFFSGGRSGGIFGNRLFVFTDDLDVTNRLFDALRDAEAHDIFGRPDPGRSPLAAQRRSDLSDAAARDRAGQSWWAPELIGRPLDRRLRVTRTSSQDSGVDARSDLIVATASLEVGFNDPTVGAVLQHKSPHDMAAYLQRKGRAGRSQQMRPWMVTVLSDYGRDRLTYQAYEQLFDPALMPQSLPVRNRHIVRMQAVAALLDWLADLLEDNGEGGWVWRALNGPPRNQREARQQKLIAQRLTDVLEGEGPWRERLAVHLQRALGLESQDDLAAILWEPPRALMLEVIPTILRRLSTQWQVHSQLGEGGQLDLAAGGSRVHPLSDFLPATLFSPLNVPDVTVIVPPATVRHEERHEQVGIVQALGHLPPGRVTRRYAYERGGLYHWVPVPLVAGEHDLPVSRYAEERDYVGGVPSEDGEVPCYRPLTIRLERVSEKSVSPTSNAVLSWRWQVQAPEQPLLVGTGHHATWGGIVPEVAFCLHSFRAPVTVRRFALGAVANLRIPGQQGDLTVTVRFTTDDSRPAAIGFEQEVDGLRLKFKLPSPATLAERAGRSGGLHLWRTAYFRHRVLHDPLLEQEMNWFQRDWLYQIYLAALLAEATRQDVSLADACAALHQGDPLGRFEEVMDLVFDIDPFQEDEEEPAHEGTGRRLSLRERLMELLHRSAVQERLQVLAAELWAPEPGAWRTWLVASVCNTLAEAALQACHLVAQRYVAPGTLLVDVAYSLPDAPDVEVEGEVWITEALQGGAGALEAIAEEATSSTPLAASKPSVPGNPATTDATDPCPSGQKWLHHSPD